MRADCFARVASDATVNHPHSSRQQDQHGSQAAESHEVRPDDSVLSKLLAVGKTAVMTAITPATSTARQKRRLPADGNRRPLNLPDACSCGGVGRGRP